MYTLEFSASSTVTRFDLHLGDCVAGMARLEAASIDLVVTSPPYNLGIRYGKFADTADRASYLDWCEEWAAQIRRLLRPNGSLFLNVGAAPSNPMLPHELILRLRKFFVLQNTIHWIKAITIPDEAGDRNFARSFQTDQFAALSERLPRIHFSSHAGREERRSTASRSVFPTPTNRISRAGATPAGATGAVAATPGSFPTKRFSGARKSDRIRRRFPVQLATNCILLHGLTRAQRMLDPFLGIGNSAVAAKRCGLTSFVGFEIDEEYLAEARRRVADRRGARIGHPEARGRDLTSSLRPEK